MIKTAITLVRLRWTLTLATLRKSAWQTVAYIFSAVLAAGNYHRHRRARMVHRHTAALHRERGWLSAEHP